MSKYHIGSEIGAGKEGIAWEWGTSKPDTQGLSQQEASRRLAANGKNEMERERTETVFKRFLSQLQDPLIYVLLAAALISVCLGEVSDAAIIGAVVLMNAFVGMLQEGKAKRALESLRKLQSPSAIVIRDGVPREIPAELLVEGDLVCLEAGGFVPADMELTESIELRVEEASLTGESIPVEKSVASTAYMSTVVTAGRGKGIVTATGMRTQIGQIAQLLREEQDETTPLQKSLGELGITLSILSLILCAGVFLLTILQKQNVVSMLITAISLAVAAIPEGLPAVVTICLALSVTRMVKVNTIIRKLPSVETLGAVSVVCSDKTGTLTQNQLTVVRYFFDGRIREVEDAKSVAEGGVGWSYLLQSMALCNDAEPPHGMNMGKERNAVSVGEPTELALLAFCEKAGESVETLRNRYRRVGEVPFTSERKRMTTLHIGAPFGQVTYTKGAPDEILKRCNKVWENGQEKRINEHFKRQVLQAIGEMSQDALRILAFAMKREVDSIAEEGLTFLGMVGMQDPIRPGVREAVAIFKKAGVRTVMITGDHVGTAFAIGRQLSIAEKEENCMTGEEMERLSKEEFLTKLPTTRIFARVSPIQKVRIVDGLQQLGEIVAMTGDGVNDAPSLKRADIGIAMGKNGTDVAKQAADMILTDDHFATIEKAIEEGRGVYENIRKSVIFLLSSNLGEIFTMFVAVICGLATPLKSGHILWINLITDSLPALALGADQNDGAELMQCTPRKREETLFSRGGFFCICFYGVLIAAISLFAFLFPSMLVLLSEKNSLSIPEFVRVLRDDSLLQQSQTYAFTVLAMSQLFHAIGMRDVHKSVFRMNHRDNKLMLLSCGLGILLQYAVVGLPFLAKAFKVTVLSLREWVYLLLLSMTPLLVHELIILFNVKKLFSKGEKNGMI